MSNKNNHSEDQDLDHLFTEAFEGAQEAVDEKDYEQFYASLEATGYFDKNRYRYLFLILLAGLLSLPAYLFLSSTPDQAVVTEPAKHQTNQTPEKPAAIPQEIESRYGPELTHEDSITAKEQKPDNSDVASAPLVLPTIPKHQAIQGSKVAPMKNITPPKDSQATRRESNGNVVLQPGRKDARPDSIVYSKQKEIKKDSLRVRYVMEVDTIIQVDSQKVSKKKWERKLKK